LDRQQRDEIEIISGSGNCCGNVKFSIDRHVARAFLLTDAIDRLAYRSRFDGGRNEAEFSSRSSVLTVRCYLGGTKISHVYIDTIGHKNRQHGNVLRTAPIGNGHLRSPLSARMVVGLITRKISRAGR